MRFAVDVIIVCVGSQGLGCVSLMGLDRYVGYVPQVCFLLVAGRCTGGRLEKLIFNFRVVIFSDSCAVCRLTEASSLVSGCHGVAIATVSQPELFEVIVLVSGVCLSGFGNCQEVDVGGLPVCSWQWCCYEINLCL